MPQIRAAPSPHLQIERLLKQVSQPGSKQTLRVQEPFTRRDATNPTQSNAHEHCAFAGTLYQARLYYSHTTQCTRTLRVGRNSFPGKTLKSHTTQCTRTMRAGRNPLPGETLLFPHNAMHTNIARRQEPFHQARLLFPQRNAHKHCASAGTLSQAKHYYSHTMQCTRALRVCRNPFPGETLLFPHNAMHTIIARRQEPFSRQDSTNPTQSNAHKHCVSAGTLYQARRY